MHWLDRLLQVIIVRLKRGSDMQSNAYHSILYYTILLHLLLFTVM